jgi:D-3-phosphoglycerate dehydrogenase
VHRLWDAADPAALLAGLADRLEIVVTTGSRGITAAEMAQLPRLKLVACFGVGYDPIDVDYARAHGIAVTNTPDVLTDDVADLTLALMLGAVRRIPQGDRFVREGRWLKGAMPLTQTLQGAKVGIIGMGRIGRAIARRCEAFNAPLAWNGPRPKADVP